MSEAPRHVVELAEQRVKARAERDYASADALRARIEREGWLVRDTADGFTLSAKPPYPVWDTVRSIPDAAPGATTSVAVGLVVDGWPDDVRQCVEALVEWTDAAILALDLGNQDGAGELLHELAGRYPDRLAVWHVAEAPHWRGGSAGWGACRTKLLQLDGADVHVLMETSTILTGDALAPLVAAVRGGAVAAGWKGVTPDESGTEWHEAGSGAVRALLGYLVAVRRADALAAMPERARYYRNADLEFSLALRGELVVPGEPLPVRQSRHHGYHDVDPDYRERESRRNYDRVLRMLRAS